MSMRDNIDGLRFALGGVFSGKDRVQESAVENLFFLFSDAVILVLKTITVVSRIILNIISSWILIGLFAGVFFIFYMYVQHVTEYTVFMMPTETTGDIVLLPFRYIVNLGYGVLRHTGEMFTELFFGLIHLNGSEFFGSFGHLLEIGSLRMRLAEYASFSETMQFAMDIVDTAPRLLLLMLCIKVVLFIYDKIRRKDKKRKYKKNITSRLFCGVSRLLLSFGLIVVSVGYTANQFNQSTATARKAYAISSLSVLVVDLVFGCISYYVQAVQAMADYFFGRGLPDFIGIFEGKFVASICHIAQNIECSTSMFMTVGYMCCCVGLILFVFEIRFFYKHNERLLDAPDC